MKSVKYYYLIYMDHYYWLSSNSKKIIDFGVEECNVMDFKKTFFVNKSNNVIILSEELYSFFLIKTGESYLSRLELETIAKSTFIKNYPMLSILDFNLYYTKQEYGQPLLVFFVKKEFLSVFKGENLKFNVINLINMFEKCDNCNIEIILKNNKFSLRKEQKILKEVYVYNVTDFNFKNLNIDNFLDSYRDVVSVGINFFHILLEMNKWKLKEVT